MSQLVKRISDHQIFAELTEFAKALELAKEASSQEQAPLDNWDRANAVAAHRAKAAGRLQPAGRLDAFEVQADIEPRRRRRLNECELFVAPQAHISLLRRHFHIGAELGDDLQKPVIQRT